MAENVQWIKLIVGMFDGESFKRIKRAKIGGEKFRDKLEAVWFELMDLAGKCNHNGAFINSREIPYTSIEDIATMIDRETDELELCIRFFINEGMVEIIDDVFMLSNWQKYQNTDGLDKIREQRRIKQKKWRDKKKALAEGKTAETAPDDEGEMGEIPVVDGDVDPNVDSTVDSTVDHFPLISISNSYISTSLVNKGECEGENPPPPPPPDPPAPPKPPKPEIYPFDEFWAVYPKKKAKEDARKAWAKLKPNEDLGKAIIKAVEDAKKTDDWKKEKGKFIPYPATYLNGKRWEDEEGSDTDGGTENDLAENQWVGTVL